MLKFNKITLEELNKIKHIISNRKTIISDLSLGFLYMWSDVTNAYYSSIDDTIIIKISKGEGDIFSFPIGNNIDMMLKELLDYSLATNTPLRFFALNYEELNYLKNTTIFKNIKYGFDERFSDYIYNFSDILNFSGKKYKGQRNHINKFISKYGNPNIKIITNNDIPMIESFLDKYKNEHDFNTLMELNEFEGTKKLIKSFHDLDLLGAYIEIDNNIAAIAIGEISNDLLIIHIEKALKEYEGIYPTMFNSFVKLINEKYTNIKLINREDDSGDIGIRTSKMQYHPIKKEHKYQAHINSLDFSDNINNNDIIINSFNESDKYDYYKLSTNDEINKYYGYDYTSDLYLESPITEDSFFNSIMFDIFVGDSINLAIRNKDGILLGEIIIWHITNKTAEIGIRLFKEYNNLGIGRKAFKLISDYVLNNYNLIPVAKCYKENISSHKMILASGFVEVSYDDTFIYFEKK